MEPVLTQFAAFTKLSGLGDATLNVRGPVGTPETMKRGLNGDGKILFRDGALKGVNFAAMVREAKGFLAGGAKPVANENNQTDFTELSGSYTIVNGVVTNKDLKMLSPLLRVTGAGTVSLPQQSVDYRVQANLVADLAGQGGALDKSGIVLPILINGPFSKLSYTPDLAGLVAGNLGNAGQLFDGVKNLDTKNLRDSGKKALENFIKPKSTPAQDGALPEKSDPAKDLLKGILGR
jgi:AsmA protein